MRRRSPMIWMRRSSGTRPPFSMMGPAFLPRGVPAEMASRSMSPVEILGIFRWEARRRACVPFPAPGGPRKITRGPPVTESEVPGAALWLTTTTDPPALARTAEPVVVAHDQLRLHLGHGVHGHAHDDEQGGAAEVEVEAEPLRHPAEVVLGEEGVEPGADARDGRHLEAGDEELGQERDHGQVEGSPEGDAAEDVVEVLRGALARTDAGDEAPVLPHVLRHVVGIEDDRGVEVAEEDDEGDVEQVV